MGQQNDEVNKDEVEPTAKLVITASDGGDFGFHSCGKCGKIIETDTSKCPFCGITLEGTTTSAPFGGSDY